MSRDTMKDKLKGEFLKSLENSRETESKEDTDFKSM